LIGVGGVLVPNQVIITVLTPDDLIGSVTALTVGLRTQAQVIGLSLFYNRFVTKLTANSVKYIVPAIVKAGVYDSKVIYNLVNGLTAVPFRDYAPLIPQIANGTHFEIVQEASIQCFAATFKSIYQIPIAFGVAACIASICMGDVSKYMDNHVAVVL
jgi:Fungal trichothecene efflux pump (TRI12)